MELLLFLLLPSILPSCSSFTPTVSYFLACGSSASVDVLTRTFHPDAPYLLSTSPTSPLPNPSLFPPSPLYAAARTFSSPTTYRFTIPSSATHFLRLHFLPFLPSLSTSHFSVTSTHFLLLHFPSLPNTTIREFLLFPDSGALDLTFSPSPLAFINAIELFSVPIPIPLPHPIDPSATLQTLTHQALETIHRINVGGPSITDSISRTWSPDDPYLLSNTTSFTNSTTGRISYQEWKGRTREVAPEAIYSTARTMAVTPATLAANPGVSFNVSWSFPVPAGYSYLIRMHFCDFLSLTAAELYFNVYVNGRFAARDLHPDAYTDGRVSSPFYLDFTAHPVGPGLVNVSIGRATRNIPASSVNAILNGIEIMKVNNSGGSLDGGVYLPIGDGSSTKVAGFAVLIASAAGGLVLIVAAAVPVIVWSVRRRRNKKQSVSQSAGGGAHLDLQIPFSEIEAATGGFDRRNIVGSGGFGLVYSGVLRDGTKVAVKRALPESKQGYPEFQTEIVLLSRIRHRHLVSLIGYCEDQSEMILVYEYMEKGTLKSYLHGGDKDFPCLSWKQRLEICIGAARGLQYLHTGLPHNIIHRDVKSSNVLLDEDYAAKVSDFGLSREGPEGGESHVSTAVKGTFGYLDPEYFKVQKLTDKSDVYSFGVLMFEVLCARPAIDLGAPRERRSLAEWAVASCERGELEKIVDGRLVGTMRGKSMVKFGETAAMCLAEYGDDRPGMGDVLWNLEYALRLEETGVVREPHEDSGKMEVGFRVVPPAAAAAASSSDGEEKADAGDLKSYV